MSDLPRETRSAPLAPLIGETRAEMEKEKKALKEKEKRGTEPRRRTNETAKPGSTGTEE